MEDPSTGQYSLETPPPPSHIPGVGDWLPPFGTGTAGGNCSTEWGLTGDDGLTEEQRTAHQDYGG